MQEIYKTRKMIIALWKRGKTNSEIAKKLIVSERLVRAVKKMFNDGGKKAIKPKRQGRKVGEKRILTKKQEIEINRILRDNIPYYLGFKDNFWTKKTVHNLIATRFGIDLKPSTMRNYLVRWKLTAKMPRKRVENQQKTIDEWLNGKFRGITNRAKNENGTIYFADKTTIVKNGKYNLNMLSATSKRGKFLFCLYRDEKFADHSYRFFSNLVAEIPKNRKIFLIMDTMPMKQTPTGRNWLKFHKERIEVFGG